VLPTLLDVATKEYHTMPREWMMNHFKWVLENKGPNSDAGKAIIAGLDIATSDSEIKDPPRSSEGAYNVLQSARLALEFSPEIAPAIASGLQTRFAAFSTGDLVELVRTPSSYPDGDQPSGLYSTLDELDSTLREELKGILYNNYRIEFIKRYLAGPVPDEDGGLRPALLRSINDLTQLENPALGWKPVSMSPPSQSVWRFKSFDPIREEDRLPIRDIHRFRDIQLPNDLIDWFKPVYDDSSWNSGLAPVGTGLYNRGGNPIANQSDWGNGEFIVMRTSFEVATLDSDFYRLSILTPQGFRVYLNGQEIAGYGWWFGRPHYNPWDANDAIKQHLKVGTNTLAVYNNVEYDMNTLIPFGQMDCMIEGLKLSDLE
jgi:hypothetical protein